MSFFGSSPEQLTQRYTGNSMLRRYVCYNYTVCY